MKLFLIERTDETYDSWDITRGYVIAADNEDEALNYAYFENHNDNDVSVKELGEANSTIEKGVILESYKAG